MSASNYLELALLDHLTNVAAFTPPGTFYVGLHTANPGETGATGEVATGSYARKDVPAAGTDWNAAASGLADNINAIQFVQATANWGTITHFSIWDAVSGGNCLLYGALAASKVVNSGDYFEFAAGALDITCD